MLAPVIQRAPSDARNTTTSATSSGLPIRFTACIPSVTSRRLGFREVRHVRIDHAWRDCIHANALGPEHGRPVLDKSLDCSFGRRVGKDRTVVQTGFAKYGA